MSHLVLPETADTASVDGSEGGRVVPSGGHRRRWPGPARKREVRHDEQVEDVVAVHEQDLTALGSVEATEAAQLLAAARGTRLYALVAVALAIGLRRGEALALRWSDVDLDGGSVTVRRTLSRVGNALTFTTSKSGKSRTVPLPAPSVRILQEHRQALITERLALGPAWTDLDLVFPSRLGSVVEPRNLLREFHALVARAGLPAARYHTLRHSCGALLVAQGVHLQVIADILGHSDIRVTSAGYAHVGEQLRRDAAERMASALEW